MSSPSGCCGFCSTERRRRRSCASPTPRRRRPTWPTACSASSRNGRASATSALAKAIVECGADAPGPRELVFARQLFARTIETPGRPQDSDAARLRRAAAAALSLRGQRPGPFQGSRRTRIEAALCSRRATRRSSNSAPRARARPRSTWWRANSGAATFDELLTEALSRAETFGAHDDAPAYAAALRAPLGLAPDVTVASVEAEMLGGDVGRMRRERWAQSASTPARRHDRNIAASLRAANRGRCAPSSRPGAARRVFQGGRRGRASRRRERPVDDQRPGADKLPRSKTICVASRIACSLCASAGARALTLERSAALFVVARSILATFARMKAERGALDFNDQIARALALVTRSSAAWVLHKLDYGLDHLLLDEAQDASPPQWGILAALSAEFFAGAGARPQEPHRLRGRRREAVHLRLPGRGARDVRGNEARCSTSAIATPSGRSPTSR